MDGGCPAHPWALNLRVLTSRSATPLDRGADVSAVDEGGLSEGLIARSTHLTTDRTMWCPRQYVEPAPARSG